MQALRDEIERLKLEQQLRRSDPETVVVEEQTIVAVDLHLQHLMRSIIEPDIMVMEKLALHMFLMIKMIIHGMMMEKDIQDGIRII